MSVRRSPDAKIVTFALGLAGPVIFDKVLGIDPGKKNGNRVLFGRFL
jgi:hypothetical protein